MKIINSIPRMMNFSEMQRKKGNIVGLVPTMGYLHEGHLSLIRMLRNKCDILIVSIFVNPTQFAPHEDFSKYPRDLERDEKLCEKESVDVIFYPHREDMYPHPYFTYIQVEKLTETMCGMFRPGHFTGVGTIVAKLFNIVNPHRAIFGKKDYQQLLIIKQMCRDLNFDVEILSGPIIREKDGLALSSRNKYLSPEDRKHAPILQKSLMHAKAMIEEGEIQIDKIKSEMEKMIQNVPGTRIEYIEILNADTLEPVSQGNCNILVALAAHFGSTRLIDNVIIKTADE